MISTCSRSAIVNTHVDLRLQLDLKFQVLSCDFQAAVLAKEGTNAKRSKLAG